MALQNLHTHCVYCDGTGHPEEYVLQAITLGLESIGFSSHAPVPFKTDWTMPPEKLPSYLQEIKQLKGKYQGKILIFCGLEIDYLPGQLAPDSPQFTQAGLDHIIGAVHFIGQDREGTHWSIDGTAEEFEQAWQRIFKGSIQKLVRQYYSLVRDMVAHHPPDIVAHLDVIIKNNQEDRYFNEQEPWYQQAVDETLKVIKQQNLILEVNAGGIIRKRADSLYPGEWILQKCAGLGIPVTLASDAHTPDQLIAHSAETAKILADIGFKEVMVFTPSGWQGQALSPR
jgi:histidinol-phosphatase (PHP family)